ncbi:MAG TPA: hypothetical protein VMV61_14775 [Patescibacteria group bacterium]|nr:hypothetical protein [Patescibacteria group bacterium]
MPRGIAKWGTLLLVSLLFVAAMWPPAEAQAPANGGDQPVYTYVALWGVPRTEWAQMEKFYKDAVPTLNKLVADGTLEAWGNARNWVHDDSGMTHASWVTATSFAKIYRALAAIRDGVPQPSAFATSKHEDLMLRSTIYGQKRGASGKGILWAANFRVREGQMDEFTRLYATEIKPLFDEQIAAGTILSYELDFQAVHTGQPGDVTLAYLMPDAAGIDRFQAALADYQTRNPDIGPALQATMDFGVHRDLVYEVMDFGQK